MDALYWIPLLFWIPLILGLYFGRKMYKQKYTIPDPVKECDYYRTHGCAHVDGMLCNIEDCHNIQDHLQAKDLEDKYNE